MKTFIDVTATLLSLFIPVPAIQGWIPMSTFIASRNRCCQDAVGGAALRREQRSTWPTASTPSTPRRALDAVGSETSSNRGVHGAVRRNPRFPPPLLLP